MSNEFGVLGELCTALSKWCQYCIPCGSISGSSGSNSSRVGVQRDQQLEASPLRSQPVYAEPEQQVNVATQPLTYEQQLFNTFTDQGETPNGQQALRMLLKRAAKNSEIKDDDRQLVQQLYNLKLEYEQEESRDPIFLSWSARGRKRNIEETNKIEKTVIQILKEKYGRKNPQTLSMLRF
tara:strand:- start:47 stop:586 length:540 start_codon:yes stop_codon:yes gene_type:complete